MALRVLVYAMGLAIVGCTVVLVMALMGWGFTPHGLSAAKDMSAPVVQSVAVFPENAHITALGCDEVTCTFQVVTRNKPEQEAIWRVDHTTGQVQGIMTISRSR